MQSPVQTYDFRPGEAPLLMSVPHLATDIPAEIATRMTAAGRAVADTDWHLDRLYDFAGDLGAAVLTPRYSRYVVDLNRDPEGRALYPGADNTGLVPTTSFAEEPLYRAGAEPDDDEITARRTDYWRPYHDRLAAALTEMRARHGAIVLFDCHSIKSRAPRFFEGRLPDLNLGTAEGASCAADLRARLIAALSGEAGYSLAVDGRFKGGYITRHYGRPADGVHAFQMELALASYMEEAPPFAFREDLAARLRPLLRRMLEAARDWAAAR